MHGWELVLAVNLMNLIADAYNALRTASYLGEHVELKRLPWFQGGKELCLEGMYPSTS